MKDFLKPSEIAEMTGTPLRTVQDWCKRGSLPTVETPGGHYRVPMAALRDRADLMGYSTSRADELDGY